MIALPTFPLPSTPPDLSFGFRATGSQPQAQSTTADQISSLWSGENPAADEFLQLIGELMAAVPAVPAGGLLSGKDQPQSLSATQSVLPASKFEAEPEAKDSPEVDSPEANSPEVSSKDEQAAGPNVLPQLFFAPLPFQPAPRPEGVSTPWLDPAPTAESVPAADGQSQPTMSIDYFPQDRKPEDGELLKAAATDRSVQVEPAHGSHPADTAAVAPQDAVSKLETSSGGLLESQSTIQPAEPSPGFPKPRTTRDEAPAPPVFRLAVSTPASQQPVNSTSGHALVSIPDSQPAAGSPAEDRVAIEKAPKPAASSTSPPPSGPPADSAGIRSAPARDVQTPAVPLRSAASKPIGGAQGDDVEQRTREGKSSHAQLRTAELRPDAGASEGPVPTRIQGPVEAHHSLVSTPASPASDSPRSSFQESGPTAVPQPELASPLKPRPPAEVKEISLSVAPDGGSDVQVRVRERAGTVQVSVHTSDREVRTALRQDLGELMTSLTRRGLSPELLSHPMEGSATLSDANNSRSESGQALGRVQQTQDGAMRGDDSSQHRQHSQRTPWELLMQSRSKTPTDDDWKNTLEAARW